MICELAMCCFDEEGYQICPCRLDGHACPTDGEFDDCRYNTSVQQYKKLMEGLTVGNGRAVLKTVLR